MAVKLYTHVVNPAPVRVLLPYVGKVTPRLQTVVDCLRIQYVSPEPHKLEGDDGYWKLLRDAWAQGEEFYIVEHDVIVWMGGIKALQECPEDWCTLGTICHGNQIYTAFGCVKFGKQLVQSHPDVWDEITDHHWSTLDANLAIKMGWPIWRPHGHKDLPPATHLNEGQWAEDASARDPFGGRIVWQATDSSQFIVKTLGTNESGEPLVTVGSPDKEE